MPNFGWDLPPGCTNADIDRQAGWLGGNLWLGDDRETYFECDHYTDGDNDVRCGFVGKVVGTIADGDEGTLWIEVTCPSCGETATVQD